MSQALQTLTDEQLAARARAGSTDCYEEIVRRYQVPLMRFLTKRFPSRRDAEDILHDTFVKAWQSLHLFDAHYAFRTWIYTISYRLAVSRGRRETLPREPLSEHAPAPGPRAELALEADETRSLLWNRARKVLSQEQYLALWLFYVEEVPAGDVAKIMEKSWVSVKTLLHRARKKLAPFVADFAPPSSPVTVKAGEA